MIGKLFLVGYQNHVSRIWIPSFTKSVSSGKALKGEA